MTTPACDRVTVPWVRQAKAALTKITALTAYDFTMARLLDRAGVDIILVGDSLSSVVQGLSTTLPVTLDEMVYHCRCVSRAVERALLVGDMPFMSYQSSAARAVESAGRMVKEGGVAAVKLEGGVHVAHIIERLVQIDIPVMGHVGLTPQSYHRMGGYVVQGRVKDKGAAPGSRDRILEDAKAVEKAGAFSIVIEGVPVDLAAEITAILSIPTIGIGAGVKCDGQVLVVSDMLGMNPEFSPRFVKRYADLAQTITQAVKAFCADVRGERFPDAERSFQAGNGDPAKIVSRLKVV